MRTRQVMRRNNELFEELREELRLNREAAARNAAAFDRNASAFDRSAAAFGRNAAAFERNTQSFHRYDDVIRAMLADMRASSERMDRKTDAVVGALADLAAEIRSWRKEGGAGEAA